MYLMGPDGVRRFDIPGHPVPTPEPKGQRRKRYVAAHSELNPTLRTAILAGKPAVGMTIEQVLACCGRPVDRQASETSEGLVERW
jgi:hypothetical protein